MSQSTRKPTWACSPASTHQSTSTNLCEMKYSQLLTHFTIVTEHTFPFRFLHTIITIRVLSAASSCLNKNKEGWLQTSYQLATVLNVRNGEFLLLKSTLNSVNKYPSKSHLEGVKVFHMKTSDHWHWLCRQWWWVLMKEKAHHDTMRWVFGMCLIWIEIGLKGVFENIFFPGELHEQAYQNPRFHT